MLNCYMTTTVTTLITITITPNPSPVPPPIPSATSFEPKRLAKTKNLQPRQ